MSSLFAWFRVSSLFAKGMCGNAHLQNRGAPSLALGARDHLFLGSGGRGWSQSFSGAERLRQEAKASTAAGPRLAPIPMGPGEEPGGRQWVRRAPGGLVKEGPRGDEPAYLDFCP